ncbi:MAG: HNH endonuclease [Prevotella sp.]|jgi:5-methylcytosine-specific restriction protein A
MKYWFLPCNPTIFNIDKAINTLDGFCWWRQNNHFSIGDIVFIYITKPYQCIRYRMVVEKTDIPEIDVPEHPELWEDKGTYYSSLGMNKLIRLKLLEKFDEDKYTLSILRLHGLNNNIQGACKVPEGILSYLLHPIDSVEDPAGDKERTTDYSTDAQLWEGAVDSVLVNRYERNHKAREECIRLKGCKCAICGFDFEKVYGPIGKHFIHVHHVVPISSIGKDYQLNVDKDLIPVCPNCHAMLHSKPGKYEVYEPDELCNMIKEAQKKKSSSKEEQQ